MIEKEGKDGKDRPVYTRSRAVLQRDGDDGDFKVRLEVELVPAQVQAEAPLTVERVTARIVLQPHGREVLSIEDDDAVRWQATGERGVVLTFEERLTAEEARWSPVRPPSLRTSLQVWTNQGPAPLVVRDEVTPLVIRRPRVVS